MSAMIEIRAILRGVARREISVSPKQESLVQAAADALCPLDLPWTVTFESFTPHLPSR